MTLLLVIPLYLPDFSSSTKNKACFKLLSTSASPLAAVTSDLYMATIPIANKFRSFVLKSIMCAYLDEPK